MSLSDVEIPQFSIVEKSNHALISIQDILKMRLFRKMVVIVVSSSNKLWKIGQINSVAFVVRKVLQCSFIENSLKFDSFLKGK